MIFSHSIKSQVKCAHLRLGHLSFFHWKAANGIWSGQEIQIHCEELPTIFLKMLNKLEIQCNQTHFKTLCLIGHNFKKKFFCDIILVSVL